LNSDTTKFANPSQSSGRRLRDGQTQVPALCYPYFTILTVCCRVEVITSPWLNHQIGPQYPCYVQVGSVFNCKIRLGERCALDQGNKIYGCPPEGIRQEGSRFEGEIEGSISAIISQGNEISRQKAGLSENSHAES
jgi:hypothetical protein